MMATIAKTIREDGEYHFGRWGSFWHRFSIANWRWSVSLCKFHEHWSLHFFCFWVRLAVTRSPVHEMMESWGFTLDTETRSLHLNWGKRVKIIYMPWMFHHCRTEVMLEDGSFVAYERYQRGSLRAAEEPAKMYRLSLPYEYRLKWGATQSVTATITAERRSWCWRAWPFKLFRWPSKVRTAIDVQFSEEVGEQRGSWKGGVVGCGYELLPNETPVECLRRMERERVFL